MISFIQSHKEIQTYRFIEIIIKVEVPRVKNPFTEVRIEGKAEDLDKGVIKTEGFCDSQDGTVFKVRFMPNKAGLYNYNIVYKEANGYIAEYKGKFNAVEAYYKGMLQVDEEYPWHFKWEGTGEHYFLNGTTAYYLLGFEDESIIKKSIDRLHAYKINRIRVLLYGRQCDRPWGTPVVNTDGYSMNLNPWVAKFPEDTYNPEFDMTAFNVAHWQKYERMLEYAREKDIIVSVVFFIGAQVLPVPFLTESEDEHRYYRYALARLSAYSNITWDIGNEHDLNRETRFWPQKTGALLKIKDPYNHLRGIHNKVYLNTWDNWLDMQLLQIWDAGVNEKIIKLREEQKASSRIVPQVIEEYGYEDLWEQFPGQRNAETRRRCAWETYMAGGYQTNGESPRTGTGTNEDTGGGWVNGRGDDSMTMLESYTYMVDFFTSFEWWKLEPNNKLIQSYRNWKDEDLFLKEQDAGTEKLVTEYKAFCLADIGKVYVVYLQAGGKVIVYLEEENYMVKRFNPRTGEELILESICSSIWESPETPDQKDWLFILQKIEQKKDT